MWLLCCHVVGRLISHLHHTSKSRGETSVLIWTFDCHHFLRKIYFHGTFAGAASSIFCSNSLYKVHGWYKVPIWTRVNILFIFHLHLKNGVNTKGYPETVPDALHWVIWKRAFLLSYSLEAPFHLQPNLRNKCLS